MADTQPPRVDNEIVQMWRRDGRLYAIAGFIAGVMLFPLLASLSENLAGFLQELAPEAVGILVTVFLIDRIIRRRDERNAEEALKRQLMLDAASQSNEKAKDAIHQLRNKGWLFDYMMENVDLSDANLQGADLHDAYLKGVDFFRSNLQEANLTSADLTDAILLATNLQKADLHYSDMPNASLVKANLQQAIFYRAYLPKADLSEANLDEANLRESDLSRAKLREASLRKANLLATNLRRVDLSKANLEGADLSYANLQDANLDNVVMDETTLLPDSTYWTKEIDLRRFTDPEWNDFWRSGHWIYDDE